MIAPLISLLALAAVFADDAPRAARSVHLRYPAPAAEIFYNEVTVERSTAGSYFMCCGFAHGYFGIQDLEDGKKLVLFSVWDPGKQDDPHSVPEEQRVEVLHQSPDVKVKRFGGEGTGAQCLFSFDWTIGKTYCCAVRASTADGRTTYAAYFRPKDDAKWVHLATFRTMTGKEDRGLTHLYSFVEDFRRDGKSVNEVRVANFGNGWIKTIDGRWTQLTKATFTASPDKSEAKETIDAGVRGDLFFLQTGGDTIQHTKLTDSMERPTGRDREPSIPEP